MQKPKKTTCPEGSIIDNKWLLQECIGSGAMGEVYKALQLSLNREVAVKIISADLLHSLEDEPGEIETVFLRFQREVQTMARVHHPNVIKIYDYGSTVVATDTGEKVIEYIAMEFIPGHNLRYTMPIDGFKDERLIVQWLTGIFLPFLDGLQAIHGHGIVHRDIKPENILLDHNVPKIVDFGLARAVRMRGVSNSWDAKGTWAYMAQEQFINFRKTGEQADIYSAGKILFEALQGKMEPTRIPFTQVALHNPQRPLPRSLDTVVQKATSGEIDKRYQRVEEMRQAIISILNRHDQTICPTTRRNSEKKDGAKVSHHRWAKILWIVIALPLLFVIGMTIVHFGENFFSSP